jgi:hypothetical protein
MISIGKIYISYSSSHNQNERLLATISTYSFRAQVGESTVRDRKKKLVQVATLLHLLMQGRPATYYEQMYVSFETLKLTNNLHRHWIDATLNMIFSV